jgi:signal transduction histidine kinase
MCAGVGESPLLLPALTFIDEGTTVEELEARFAMAGADLRFGRGQALLTELESLGLVQVGALEPVRRYVLSSLGWRIAHRDSWSVATDALKDLEGLRTDLLSVMSHELRTPITVIRTVAGLLLDRGSDVGDEQRGHMLLTVERNAERMQYLIDQVLDLARYRSGTLGLQLRPFDPVELCKSVVDTIRPLADARHQVLDLDVPGGPTPKVIGDRRRLEQALLNLITNAHHFAAEHIAFRLDEPTDGTIRWSVKDDGPGIGADDLARIFERFFARRPDQRETQEGVGLGLPTALAIAHAHGGSIHVASRLRHGTTFTLRIPVAGPDGGAISSP